MDTKGQVIHCKGAVTWAVGEAPVIEDIEVDPPQKGELRVKILWTGVCHSDLSGNNGHVKVNYPIVCGHEGAGVVESVGEGVTAIKPGDHILTTFSPQCRKCHVCLTMPDRNMCLANQVIFSWRMSDGSSRLRCKGKDLNHFVGCSTFAEYAVIAEYSACKINQNAPMDKVCLLACGVTTGYGAALNSAKVTPGSTCAVWGLGGVGLATVMGCKKAGAKRIFGIDTSADKAVLGKSFGVTDFLNPTDQTEPIAATLNELTQGGVDFCFDCVGSPSILAEAVAASHPAYGTTVMVGVPRHDARLQVNPCDILFGRRLVGSWCGGWKSLDDIPILVEEYMNKTLNLDDFISTVLPLSELNKAYSLMTEGKVIRTVLKVGAL